MILLQQVLLLTDPSLFPSTGTNFVQIGNEEISYTGINHLTN